MPTHLGKPRPDLLGLGADRDCMVGDHLRSGNEFVSGHAGGSFGGGRTGTPTKDL
ncbi:MAG TPA: hypothetical protein VFZ85_07270 [Jiangellaceae bacterium]